MLAIRLKVETIDAKALAYCHPASSYKFESTRVS